MVVDSDGEVALGFFLAYDIVIEVTLDLGGLGELS